MCFTAKIQLISAPKRICSSSTVFIQGLQHFWSKSWKCSRRCFTAKIQLISALKRVCSSYTVHIQHLEHLWSKSWKCSRRLESVFYSENTAYFNSKSRLYQFYSVFTPFRAFLKQKLKMLQQGTKCVLQLIYSLFQLQNAFVSVLQCFYTF